MNAQYLPAFIKDLKRLRGSEVYRRVRAFAFEDIAQVTQIRALPGVKRLQGSADAYRLRFGDYRLGFYVRNETIVFARVLHRKEIYRYFP